MIKILDKPMPLSKGINTTAPARTTRSYQNRIKALIWSSASSLMLLSPAAFGAEAVLIGGGYDIHGSQGQIELNVKWVQSVLNDQGLNVSTYFTDGDEDQPDVHYTRQDDETPHPFEALARVFGDWILETRAYRDHTVNDVSGSTRRSELEPALIEHSKRTADSDLLLVYNGHGTQSYSTPDQVKLNLWDNSTLSANELHRIFKPREAPLKFVFTQCYSGGFHRLAYQNPVNGLELAEGPRCGFTAESAYKMAEGCSASINTDDYRDYTTFFFAALAGFERDGEIVDSDPDTNQDGATTLREAHLYTLNNAISADLSRSTSEDFLNAWQPWYLRWLPAPKNSPNNEYARVFRDLANRHGVELSSSVAKNIRHKLSTVENKLGSVEQQTQMQDAHIRELQIVLQNKSASRWPAILGPYTGAYQELITSGELTHIVAELESQAEYTQLRDLQTQQGALDLESLALEREATQYKKMLRMRRLAMLKQQMADYGTATEKSAYASLLGCEETTLNPG